MEYIKVPFFHFRRLRNDYDIIEPCNLIGICQTARTIAAPENLTLKSSSVSKKGMLTSSNNTFYGIEISMLFLISYFILYDCNSHICIFRLYKEHQAVRRLNS